MNTEFIRNENDFVYKFFLAPSATQEDVRVKVHGDYTTLKLYDNVLRYRTPKGVNLSKTEASLREGILTVTFPNE